jgi:hypothetical protein
MQVIFFISAGKDLVNTRGIGHFQEFEYFWCGCIDFCLHDPVSDENARSTST